MMPEWLTLLGQFGLPIALTVFFVMQGRDREKRMGDRLDKVEDYVRSEFAEIVERTTTVIADNSRVMRDLESWLEKASDSRITRDVDIHQAELPHITQRKSGQIKKPPNQGGQH